MNNRRDRDEVPIRVAVLYGHGINCDRETSFAIEKAKKVLGSTAEEAVVSRRVHTNQLVEGKEELADYQMLVLPGGFLHGDDISAGKILAGKLKTELADQLDNFLAEGKLLLGICNGFQVMVKYPLLPEGEIGPVTLDWNDSGRFIDRWVHLKVEDSPCVYLEEGEDLYLPIRHAEGKFLAEAEVLDRLERESRVVLRYADEEGAPAAGRYPLNPNGSLRDVAGICDGSGRIFGLMPHPEAYVDPLHHPNWNLQERAGELPARGGGLKVFENALRFMLEEFC